MYFPVIPDATPRVSSDENFDKNSNVGVVGKKEVIANSCESHHQVNESLFDGLSNDLDEIIAHSGLVPRHFSALQNIATETGYIIAFRPVDHLATWYIAADYPTKNYHIKGKTSSFGPMAGLIPIDQSLSKLENAPASEWVESNKKVQDCLNDRQAVVGPLTLSAERLRYLLESGVIEIQGYKNDKILYARGPSGKMYEFQAMLDEEGNVVTVSHKGNIIEVLCDPQTGQPFTADYDLMLVGSPMEQYGAEDISPVMDVSWEYYLERTTHYTNRKPSPPLEERWPSEESFYEKVDKDVGNASPRIQRLIGRLNEAMNCKPGRPVVHHGSDASNPGAKPGDNYPVTLFLPHPLDWIKETVLMAINKDALARIIKAGKQAGFYMPVNNSKWEPELRVRRPSFEQAREFLEARLPHLLVKTDKHGMD